MGLLTQSPSAVHDTDSAPATGMDTPGTAQATAINAPTTARRAQTAAAQRRTLEGSDGDEAVGVLDKAGDVGWADPLRAELGQVVVGRPTGGRATLSDVDRQRVLAGLGEQVPQRWHSETLDRIASLSVEQFGGISSKDQGGGLAGFEGAVHCQV